MNIFIIYFVERASYHNIYLMQLAIEVFRC